MPGIILTPRDSFDDAYRKFKRQCDRNLIVTEARARQYYETATEKKKKEKIATRKKILKKLFMIEDMNLDCKFRFGYGDSPYRLYKTLEDTFELSLSLLK